MTDVELSWAAGMFEGDGCVRISTATPRGLGALEASVTNTDPEVVEYFSERWGGVVRPCTGLGPSRRPAWAWRSSCRVAAVFLYDIEPFVVRSLVRERIRHALQFQRGKVSANELRTPAARYEYAMEQFDAYLWMAELNARGAGPRVFKRRG